MIKIPVIAIKQPLQFPVPIGRPNTPINVTVLQAIVDLTNSSDSEFDLFK